MMAPGIGRAVSDRGAFAPLVAVLVIALFLMVGLCVDGGGRMRTAEHATDVAAEAARAGGQAIDLPAAVTGTADEVDPAGAVAAAQAYLAAAGASGDVTVAADRRSITVVVHTVYHPVMLDLIGLGPWTETGTATAVLLTG